MTAEVDECAICTQELKETNVSVSDCNHKFHFKCLHKWIKKSDTCPVCRKQLIGDTEEVKEDSDISETSIDDFNDESYVKLIRAVTFGDLNEVKQLVYSGFEVRVDSRFIESAAFGGHLPVIKFLVAQGSNPYDALYNSIVYGHINNVRFLIDNYVDIRLNGDELLQIAVQNEKPDIVKYLVSKGANCNFLLNHVTPKTNNVK